MTKARKSHNFEATLNELEALVAALESGDLPLEQSLATFEQGIKLTRVCQNTLQQAELKVRQLLSDDAAKVQEPDTRD